ncbi:TPA: hypothetical protein DEX28_01960 [Patescibacteria group bacterium]|nr:MAG: hypothetical protein UW85_C0001G0061 [Parcubacteria group bacterium GW2011_GWA1_Parcubacteria_45_10]KKT89276.1 MAG: hypothetical protein UW89_C0001G0004 [Parcubacteria group bacterium GW2011_GWB1_45_10]HCI05488.1 hypothetical protein [Patescibacteria group bacterium]
MTANKLVLDIETIGKKFDGLDELSKEILETRFKKRAKDEDELQDLKDKLTFFPPLSEIVAIGMLNPETNKGVAIFQSRTPIAKFEENNIEYLAFQTEKELLEKFWQLAMGYEEFITFNGKSFDMPMLMVRSAVNQIKPGKNLMHNRYLSLQPMFAKHVDLADELGFYGAKNDYLGLHFWTKAFGIESPKQGGVSGDDVGRLFDEGKFLEIAKYCMGDVFATSELYKKWDKHLRFS